MTSAVQRFATPEPTICGVCRRTACGLGYAPKAGAPILWLCDNPACHDAARIVYAMPPKTLDAYEIGAALEAGEEAGAFLDEIGTTDLAKLTANQWREFLRRLFTGFESSMRRKILEHEPPF